MYDELLAAMPEKDAHGRAKGIYDYFGTEPARGLRERIASNTSIMRHKLQNLKSHPIVDKYLNSETLWDEVVEIKNVGKKQTYDLEVDTHHNYVADNIVTHNSMTISSSAVGFGFLIPYMRILTVTPLFEQVRRLSQNYVKPFIAESPIRGLIVNPQCSDSVLQRDLANHSILYFSYAFTSVTRCRGISTYAIFYDELGELDPEYPSIINRCADSAPDHLKFFRRLQEGPI
jgi:hypothetical protein